MTSLHGNHVVPAKIDAFSLKVRVMIDQRYFGAIKQSRSNVIQFPSSAKRLEQKKAPHVYLEVCQQLLNPVRHFFYEVNAHYPLDVYLGELERIASPYFDGDQLNPEECQDLQADIVALQLAGFEHTNELMPQVIVAHGDQLATRYLGSHYGELAQTNDMTSLLKKAYADVKGMIEHAKLMLNHSERPTLRRR